MPLVSKATVYVTICFRRKYQHGNYSGKIATRVGEVLVRQQKVRTHRDERGPHQQGTYDVFVPGGSVLSIEVDWQRTIGYGYDERRVKHLQVLKFDEQTRLGTSTIDGHEVTVKIYWENNMMDIDQGSTQKFICDSPSRAVEVKMLSGDDIAIVYTIGDEVSFTEFITTLRCILAYHPYREDILDDHNFLNLSSTRQHPVLPKLRSGQPRRWLHVKLQAVKDEETSWTTLLMRDDNVYVHGFKNRQGVLYELLSKNGDISMFPRNYKPQSLDWGLKYRTILRAGGNEDVVRKLKRANLGCNFAKKAVRVLSRFSDPDVEDVDNDIPRLALAGLIVIVCESARMNPLHDSFAREWISGKGFTEELMKNYVWGYYGAMSAHLCKWKYTKYAEPELQLNPIEHLQNIFLVLNTGSNQPGPRKEDQKNHHQPRKHGDHGAGGSSNGGAPDDNNKSRPDSQPKKSTGNAPSGRGRDKGSYGAGRQQQKRARDEGNDIEVLQRQHKKADNSSRDGSPDAIKSKEAANTAGSSSGPATKPGEAADAAGNGGGSPSQPRETDDDAIAGSGFGSGFGESGDDDDDDDPSGGNRGSQSREADGAQCHGRPRVELLAICADLWVADTTIIVFDGKRGQNIYTHKEHGGKQGGGRMVDLVLTGPYAGISAYGCFAIKIEIPPTAGGDAGGLIEWEWDCYSKEFAAEVDTPPVRRTISSSDPGHSVEVTYAVMSNALEATVAVMLHLKDGHSPGDDNGTITALIDGFEVSSVLSSRIQGTGQCSSSWFHLDLDRNLVVVPCGRVLHIGVDLPIKTSIGCKRLKANLMFENGSPSQSHEDDGGDKVQVNITWHPEITLQGQTSEEIDVAEFITVPPERSRLDEEKMANAQGDITRLPSSANTAGKQKITDVSGKQKITDVSESSHQVDAFTKGCAAGQEESESIGLEPSVTISGVTEIEEEIMGRLAHPDDPELADEASCTEAAEVKSARNPNLVYTIADDVMLFVDLVVALRGIVANHRHREDILDRHNLSNLSSTRDHPVLHKVESNRGGTAEEWVHIKLQVEEGGEETTLLVRDDCMLVGGFVNQQGVLYRLASLYKGRRIYVIAKKYHQPTKILDWGFNYSSILAVDPRKRRPEEIARKKLDSARLGKTFAVEAVRALSRFQPDDAADDLDPRLALAGLMVMLCESARFNPVQDTIASAWNSGARITMQLANYWWHWARISTALLRWKDEGYQGWTDEDEQLESIGIKNQIDALRVIRLVYNARARVQ